MSKLAADFVEASASQTALRCEISVRPQSTKMIKMNEMAIMTERHREVPTMDTMTAADAKTNFGALLDKAQREPVTISKNGRPVAVVMSATAYEEQQRLKLDLLRQEVSRGLEDLKRRKLVAAKEAFTQLDSELKD